MAKKPSGDYSQEGELRYDKQKKQYDNFGTRGSNILPGQNTYEGPDEPSKAGAGRGKVNPKTFAKGGLVRRGYGKARK